jgi:dienelactone hydrolase
MGAHSRRELLSIVGIGIASEAGPARAARQAPQDSSPPRPSIGNLFEQVGAYARENPPALSFLDHRWKDLGEWKAAARAKVLDGLSYRPRQASFAARALSKTKKNGYVQEEVVFQTTPHTEVPASLLLPAGTKKPRPALVALHDHGGFYYFGREKLLEQERRPAILASFCEKLYEGVPYAAELARAGYVVLVIDAFYFGQRRLRADTLPPGKADALLRLRPGSDEFISAFNKLAGSYEQLVAKTIFMAGASWPGIMVWDDLRSVDYLLTRPEVDKTRIGCLGLSLGGFRSAYLAGCHPAVRSAVVTCWMSTFGPMLANYPQHHTWMCYTPDLYQYLDLPDVAGMAASNSLLVQFGRRDVLFPAEGKRQAADKLTGIYAKAGTPRNFQASFYDAPHMFSIAMQREAMEWFRKTLP